MEDKSAGEQDSHPQQVEAEMEDLDKALKRLQDNLDKLNGVLKGDSDSNDSNTVDKDDSKIRAEQKQVGFEFDSYFQSLNVDQIIASALCNPDRTRFKTFRFYDGG